MAKLYNYIDPTATVGSNTLIEDCSIISEYVVIGNECKIHRHVFIDKTVQIGNRVKIQDNVMIPRGVTLEDGVFVGPSVTFTNDLYPRAINQDGTIKTSENWQIKETNVKYGASIGANATIVCGITIGEWSMIGAGSVVTKDVPPYTLVVGNPAKVVKVISKNG